MGGLPNILCVGDQAAAAQSLSPALRELFRVVAAPTVAAAIEALRQGDGAGLLIGGQQTAELERLDKLLENERIIESLPDGLVLLEGENKIVWANQQMRGWCKRERLDGENFYTALGSPEILGPDFCPFHTAVATGAPSSSTLRLADNRYFHLHVALVERSSKKAPQHLIVIVRDVTQEILQQQKLAAIHQAGVELANLTPDEVFQMGVQDRIELLKSNILHYTKDLLNFDVVEIRLLEQETGKLSPLLSVGLDQEASERSLFALPQNNGVTGFVASTGKSYLCENTAADPLYLQGFAGAKSSLTVPLMLNDKVIGTFNVESPEPRAFTESDLQFLEIFSRDVAYALNTLELLVAQKANAAQESVEAIHSAVALPVDEILNDAVNVMERYIGHEQSVVDRLQRILKNARDIKQMIQQVGQKLTPAEAVPAGVQGDERKKFKGRRALVVDAAEDVRQAAHALLERFGCEVETAHEGGEAVFMVRNMPADHPYDVVIADIRLPDMSGYDFLIKLRDLMDPVPLVLMTGFGYDPGHSIVKARQAGLAANSVLYKPFRLDQLIKVVEGAMQTAAHKVPQQA